MPPSFSHRVPPIAEPNAWTRALAARREAGETVLDLTDADPTRAGLSPLVEAAEALARVGPLGYAPEPRGTAAARAAVASALADRGPEPPLDDLVLTASTSEAYAHLFRLLANPGEAVLVPTPSYPLFEPIARAEGVAVRPYPLRFDGAWHLDRAALEAAAAGARAIVTVEPNHPTGTCLDPDDRAFLERLAVRTGAAIVADEVFGEHPLPGHGPLPTWRGEREVLTFVLGGLSKRCGLPQLKLGWIAVAGPGDAKREALARLEWLGDLFLSVGSPVQAALPELLALRHAFTERVRERITANLAALDAMLAAHPACTRLPAHGGWTCVLRVPATRSDEAWALALLERGVAIHPGHFYDLAPGEHLVASLIVEPATFARGLESLAMELAQALRE